MKPRKTIIVSGEEMRKISKYFHAKYPYIYRDNNLYSASVVDAYELTINEDCIEEMQSLLKPCTIHGFEL